MIGLGSSPVEAERNQDGDDSLQKKKTTEESDSQSINTRVQYPTTTIIILHCSKQQWTRRSILECSGAISISILSIRRLYREYFILFYSSIQTLRGRQHRVGDR